MPTHTHSPLPVKTHITRPTEEWSYGVRVIATADCYCVIDGKEVLIAKPGKGGFFVRKLGPNRAIIQWDRLCRQVPHNYNNFRRVGDG